MVEKVSKKWSFFWQNQAKIRPKNRPNEAKNRPNEVPVVVQ